MSDALEIRIVHLLEEPEAARTLEQWFIEEWAPWYGLDGPGDAARDLEACNSIDDLPICLIAIGPDREILGTASLKTESAGSEQGMGPWMAAVLVDRSYRRQGVGTALVMAIGEEAKRLGFEAVFTSSDSAIGILRRLDWKKIGNTQTLRGRVPIFSKRL